VGDRLAKDLDALYRAKAEQMQTWREGLDRGEIGIEDAVPVLFELCGVLKDLIVRLASEIDDPPRRNEP
jgi:hypothetical protein